MKIRKHLVFYGSVQGVGFRYRAIYAAQRFGCTGWVRNEWDGSVVMEIQGEEKDIDQVIISIEAGKYIWINNLTAVSIPVEDNEIGFISLE